MKGKVYLVGAGPGDYKLLTLKGLECIKEADVIVYDRLVNKNYLKEAKKECELIYVGKESSNHTLSQENINKLIANKAKEGKIVTRLKGGDPYVFGRGGEEGEFLNSEGIEFEVVPGITSAIGGLCYAGIPITHRDHSSSFHIITGHLRDDNKKNPEINWNALSNIKGTLVFLMGVSNIKKISENLIKEGKEKNTPACLISFATRYNQKVVTSTLENLYEVSLKENIKSPTLIVIGDVVKLRDKLNFFENKPLFGKSIIVTRTRCQSSSLSSKISDLGGNAIEIPTIKIEKIKDNKELENEIKNIKDYNYLILTSKNAVDIFFDKLDELNLDCRHLSNIKVCAIGQSTENEIKKRGIISDIVPKKFASEYLFKELEKVLKPTDKVLIPRSKNARDFLVDNISKICEIKEVHTYKTLIDDTKKEEILEMLSLADYITFSSSSSVTNFVNIIGEDNLDKLNKIKVISIGEITTNTCNILKVKVYKQATSSTIESMIDTIIEDN